MTAFHPTQPFPIPFAAVGFGARRAGPAAQAERPLWLQSTDPGRAEARDESCRPAEGYPRAEAVPRPARRAGSLTGRERWKRRYCGIEPEQWIAGLILSIREIALHFSIAPGSPIPYRLGQCG